MHKDQIQTLQRETAFTIEGWLKHLIPVLKNFSPKKLGTQPPAGRPAEETRQSRRFRKEVKGWEAEGSTAFSYQWKDKVVFKKIPSILYYYHLIAAWVSSL